MGKCCCHRPLVDKLTLDHSSKTSLASRLVGYYRFDCIAFVWTLCILLLLLYALLQNFGLISSGLVALNLGRFGFDRYKNVCYHSVLKNRFRFGLHVNPYITKENYMLLSSPDKETRSSSFKPWRWNMVKRFWMVELGAGMFVLAPLRLAVLESLLPSGSSHDGPPLCIEPKISENLSYITCKWANSFLLKVSLFYQYSWATSSKS